MTLNKEMPRADLPATPGHLKESPSTVSPILADDERKGKPAADLAGRLFSVFTAPSHKSSTWRADQWTLDELEDHHSTFDDHKESNPVVFGTFKGTRRTKADVLTRSVLTLDADYADDGLLARLEARGVRAYAHTTYNSTEDSPRYRVLIPLARDVSAEAYSFLADAVMDMLGRDNFDLTCNQPERLMYGSSEKVPGTGVFVEFEGPLMDPVPFIATQPFPSTPGAFLAVAPLYGIALHELSDGDRLPSGPLAGQGWDAAVFTLGCAWVRAANSVPSTDIEAEHERFLRSVPPAEGTYDPEHKWRSAAKAVGDDQWLSRPTPLDDFGAPLGHPEPLTRAVGQPVATADGFAALVAQKKIHLAAHEEAKRELNEEKSDALELPSPASLSDFLDVPDEEVPFLIADLLARGAHNLLAAAYKAGKTTLVGNLLRSLVDGVPFLGRFAVASFDGYVLLIDDELDERTLRRWLRDIGIVNTDRVRVISLRGKVSTFNILDESTRQKWAELIRGAAVVILDCLRPVLDALGLDENHDAGRFLTAFDELLGLAGVSEALVVHHMGHNGERSRGDSRLQDWPDATWKLVREKQDDPSSLRFFSAFGRDVNVPEGKLVYDPETRALTLDGASRATARASAALPAVLEGLSIAAEPINQTRLIQEASLVDGSFSRDQYRDAIKLAVRQGLIVTAEGPRKSILHSLPAAEDVL